MKPDKLSVHDLFQRERRYVVPLYQRSYVWTREDQWELLWEDIERQADACLEAEDHVARRSHFLGAIVLNVAKIVGNSVARSEIIDGQQRLTTLQVLLAALRDYAYEIGSTHAAKLTRLTINEDERPGSDGAFKVWPTNADRQLFRTVLTAKSPTALLKLLNLGREDAAPRLAAAYFYFHGAIRQYVDRGNETGAEGRDHQIFGLVQALRTALQLIVIELEENDDPQVIFETLNARGQPLLPSDLIRNLVFLQAANNSNLNADELYDRYWRPFDDRRLQEAVGGEDRFWHVEERQGRLTRARIDLFIFHYLVMKTERDLNIGQLFREFRDWRDHEPQSVETFLADLMAHSDVFARLIAPTEQNRLASFARRLKFLDTSTVYPLLLFLLSLPTDRLPASERDQILDDLESWLVRRFVCQLTNKNYNRFFVSLLSKVKRIPDGISNVLRAELMRSQDVTVVWPSDDEFKRSWLQKPIYVRSRVDRCAMVLRAIEEKMRSSKNENVLLTDKLSVEHLLPQKGKLADYPFASSMPKETGETNERCRERLLHAIGNLTLLTQELNSAISNGPFESKKDAIVADSDLRLNAWLRNNPIQTWSEIDIISRGETMFETAIRIWQFPSAQAKGLNATISSSQAVAVTGVVPDPTGQSQAAASQKATPAKARNWSVQELRDAYSNLPDKVLGTRMTTLLDWCVANKCLALPGDTSRPVFGCNGPAGKQILTFSTTYIYSVLRADRFKNAMERSRFVMDLKQLSLYAQDFDPASVKDGRNFSRKLGQWSDVEFLNFLEVLSTYCRISPATSAQSAL